MNGIFTGQTLEMAAFSAGPREVPDEVGEGMPLCCPRRLRRPAATSPGEMAGDEGKDANHLHRILARRGTAAVIPSTSSRKGPIPHDTERYELRNVIERTFCRIKDFRGIATRYAKTARHVLAAVCLVSAITHWA